MFAGVFDATAFQQLIAELVNQRDAPVNERLARVKVVDIDGQEVQHVVAPLALARKPLTPGVLQPRGLVLGDEGDQAHALKLVQLEPNRLNGGRELVCKRVEVDRLVNGLSHSNCLKQSFGLVVRHPASPPSAPYLPAQPASAARRKRREVGVSANRICAPRVRDSRSGGPKGGPNRPGSGIQGERNPLYERVSRCGPGRNRTSDRRIMSPLL